MFLILNRLRGTYGWFAKVNSVKTIEDLATQDGVVFQTIIVEDLNRGGTFIWSPTGTANGGTVFAGATVLGGVSHVVG